MNLFTRCQPLPVARSPLSLPFFLLLVLLPHLVASQSSDPPPQPPLFTKILNQQVKLEFGPINRFVLECSANGQPAPRYTWFKNGKEVTEDTAGIELLSTQEPSLILEFSTPAPDHEGYYHCIAENEHGKAKSTVVHVTPDPPRIPKSAAQFTTYPEIQVLRAGNTARFNCEAKGNPEPSIVWSKNGEELEGRTGNELVIHNIGPEDVANYACNASNAGGYVYRDTYLTMLTVAATITDGPKDMIVSKGSNVTIKCETDGYPKPTVEWFLNGENLEASERHLMKNGGESLLILNAGHEDEGKYACEASNHGKARKSGELVVKSKTEIIHGPELQSVQVFSDVVMNCSVVSDLSEQLTVIWKKNNVDLGHNVFVEDERISQDENYNLIIRNVTLDDGGTYTCVAFTESTVSNPAAKSGLLTVTGIPPVLAEIDELSEQLEGAEVKIRCEILEGYETPSLDWYKDGLPVEESSSVKIDGDTLTLTSLTTEHSGEYTCQAVNPWGRDMRGAKLWVRRRTKILTLPVYLAYTQGTGVQIDCKVDVDPVLGESLSIDWYRGDEMLEPTRRHATNEVRLGSHEGPAEEYADYDYGEDTGVEYEDRENNRYIVYSNHTLEIKDLRQEDVGLYKCVASTSLEPSLLSQASEIYVESEFPWWIVIMLAIIVLALLVLIFVVVKIRQRSKGKGYYGVKDIEQTGAATNGKHNKSDIYYTTEDGDSIMLEQDNVPFTEVQGPAKPPIFTPKTIRHLAAMDKSTGSCGSLLDDEFLKRGMDEDGSFRERYAD